MRWSWKIFEFRGIGVYMHATFLILMALVGFFTSPFLMFIALFVWIGAGQEASIVTMKASLGGVPVQRAMMTKFVTLKPNDSLQRAIELVWLRSPFLASGRTMQLFARPPR